MKYILLIILLCFNILLAQSSKEELLKVISRNDLKFTEETKDGIYKVEYPDGKTIQNLPEKERIPGRKSQQCC